MSGCYPPFEGWVEREEEGGDHLSRQRVEGVFDKEPHSRVATDPQTALEKEGVAIFLLGDQRKIDGKWGGKGEARRDTHIGAEAKGGKGKIELPGEVGDVDTDRLIQQGAQSFAVEMGQKVAVERFAKEERERVAGYPSQECREKLKKPVMHRHSLTHS